MLGDRIRHFRMEKGLSQEELAEQLHVVRQTVSKWEKGLSAPDAELLVDLSRVLEVPVGPLLGVEEAPGELERVTALLEEARRREETGRQVSMQRGKILLLSFLALLAGLVLENGPAALAVTGACMLGATAILWRNLDLLTGETAGASERRLLRRITLGNVGLLVLGILFGLLVALDVLTISQQGEKLLALILVACLMVFGGLVSPRLPFTRHTGLRLPWTVMDEDTWKVAHRALGVISLPMALGYVACALTLPWFEEVTLAAMALWVGIPAGLSYGFFRRKMRGRE